jgi:molybdate transport system substrate-binding protein
MLARGGFKHLAVVNPKLAPYGAAVLETRYRLQLPAALKPKFVSGENIAQTYQFVASGNAELGFVALSLMVGGNIPGQTRVVSVQIYDHVEAMEYGLAHQLALVLMGFPFVTLLVLNGFNRREVAFGS